MSEPVMARRASRAVQTGEANQACDTLERKVRNAWRSIEQMEVDGASSGSQVMIPRQIYIGLSDIIEAKTH